MFVEHEVYTSMVQKVVEKWDVLLSAICAPYPFG